MSRAPELPGTFSSSLVIILIAVEEGNTSHSQKSIYFYLYILSAYGISSILFFLCTFTTFTVSALPVL